MNLTFDIPTRPSHEVIGRQRDGRARCPQRAAGRKTTVLKSANIKRTNASTISRPMCSSKSDKLVFIQFQPVDYPRYPLNSTKQDSVPACEPTAWISVVRPALSDRRNRHWHWPIWVYTTRPVVHDN